MRKVTNGTSSKLNEALQLHLQGNMNGAELAYQQVLEKESHNSVALENLATLYLMKRQCVEAEKYLSKAIKLHPSNPELYHKLGAALQEQGKLEPAIESYVKAIKLRPAYYEVYLKLGIAYHQAKYTNQAVGAFQKAIILRPNQPDVYYNLGLSFHEQGNLEEAIKSYQQALALKPDYFDAYANLGAALKDQGMSEEAIQSYQQALALRPHSPDVYINLGIALHGLGRFRESIGAYQQAIALDANNLKAHLNISMSLLHLDNYELGWKEYEWRLELYPNNFQKQTVKRWDGTLDSQNELILVEEQGIGDVIQFLRYGSLLKQSFPRVSIIVREALAPLIEMTEIFDQVYSLTSTGETKITATPDTKWLPIMSLPGILGVTKADPLLNSPYIKVDSLKAKNWQEKIRTCNDFMVVGINWQGNPEVEKNNFKGRSLSLSEFSSLASIPGVQFVSLQKGYGSEQVDTCSFVDRFVECQEEINQTWDFVETAAIIEICDLVITSDTSIAHLAGAMGKATWILLKKIPEWRWGLEGETCSWYPSARLFRQTQTGNWSEVMERVAAELSLLASKD